VYKIRKQITASKQSVDKTFTKTLDRSTVVKKGKKLVICQ